MSVAPYRCTCGRMPTVRCAGAADGHVKTWVQCQARGCGASGTIIIEDYCNDAAAIADWNSGNGRRR